MKMLKAIAADLLPDSDHVSRRRESLLIGPGDELKSRCSILPIWMKTRASPILESFRSCWVEKSGWPRLRPSKPPARLKQL